MVMGAIQLEECFVGCPDSGLVDCTAQSLVVTTTYLFFCIILHFIVLNRCIIALTEWERDWGQILPIVLVVILLHQLCAISEQGHMWLWSAQFIHTHPWDTYNFYVSLVHHALFSSYVSLQAGDLAKTLATENRLPIHLTHLRGLYLFSMCLAGFDVFISLIFIGIFPIFHDYWIWMTSLGMYVVIANTIVIMTLVAISFRIKVSYSVYSKKMHGLLIAHALSLFISCLEQYTNLKLDGNPSLPVIPQYIWGFHNFTSVVIYLYQFRKDHATRSNRGKVPPTTTAKEMVSKPK